MCDYISREAMSNALDALCDRTCVYSKKQRASMCGACALGGAFDVVEELQAEEVRPVKRGRWIDKEPDVPDWSYKKSNMSRYCSSCLHPAGTNKHKTYRFCPWCGAEMKEGEA